jgi:hypothetical protein
MNKKIVVECFFVSLTNCALSRTGLAAIDIGADCDRITCGVGAGAFVFDIAVY